MVNDQSDPEQAEPSIVDRLRDRGFRDTYIQSLCRTMDALVEADIRHQHVARLVPDGTVSVHAVASTDRLRMSAVIDGKAMDWAAIRSWGEGCRFALVAPGCQPPLSVPTTASFSVPMG